MAIDISDLEPTPDSPQISGGTKTIKYLVLHGEGEEILRAFQDKHGEQDGSFFLDSTQCSLNSAAGYDEINIVYTSESNSSALFSVGGSSKTYSCSSVCQEHAIEEAPKYKFCWNHNLYELVAEGESPSGAPSWASSATTGEGADGIKYLWADSQPQSPLEDHGWVEVLHRTKKANSYLVPSVVVTETRTFRSRKEAENAIRNVGVKGRPSKTFGAGGEWLVMASRVSAANGIYTCETEYQNDPVGFDSDLYN